MHKKIISKLLSTPSGKVSLNIFDEYIREMELYFSRKVTNISEMKLRDNKKIKGDMWELFCRDWLLSSDKYIEVWLLKDCPHFPNITKQDNGIDLIAQTKTGYCAIQCKYRSKKGRVDWKSLSTFIGLCERTGPWEKYIVMTNCSSVTRKVPKSPKDYSICLKSFQGTTREHWMKMVGTYQEHKLSDDIKSSHNFLSEKVDLELIRKARLSKFDQNIVDEV